MLVGLCGSTDLYNMERTEQANQFSKRHFKFSDYTDRWIRAIGLQHQSQCLDQLIERNNYYGILTLRQRAEDIINAVDPKLYTDFMTQQLFASVFSGGLKLSTQVTEAVIVDVKYELWAKWLRGFGADRNSRRNRLVGLVRPPNLPSSLLEHVSEKDILDRLQPESLVDIGPEVFEPLRDLRRLDKLFYSE